MLISMAAHFRVTLLPAIGRDLDMSAGRLACCRPCSPSAASALDRPVGRLADHVAPLRLLAIAAAAVVVPDTHTARSSKVQPR